MPDTDQNPNVGKIAGISLIQFLAMFFVCYSGICIISLTFKFIFDKNEFFIQELIGHIYGFLASNLAIFLLEISKNKLMQQEEEEHE